MRKFPISKTPHRRFGPYFWLPSFVISKAVLVLTVGVGMGLLFNNSHLVSAQIKEHQYSIQNPNQVQVNGSPLKCPLRCLCFKTTVRCMFLHLEKIPPEIPIDTTILDLRFNRIKDIPPGAFQQLTNLHTLLLNNNNIVRLDKDSFKGLQNLKHLYLYKNRIREVNQNAFQELTQLEMLYLHYNLISEFQSGTFSNLSKLERLFLHNNKIQRIPPGSFNNLNNMKRLRLDGNALVCDCGILNLAKMLDEHTTHTAAICQKPKAMQGKGIQEALTEMKDTLLSHCKKPVITEEPRDIEINFGSTVYFRCRVEGDGSPSVVWLHNSNEISPSSEPRYSILNDGTLMIANAHDGDLGIYECMARSSYGEAKSRQAKMKSKKSVVNKIRPRFTKVPTDEQVVEGTRVELICQSVGNPEPQIFWFFNDEPLVISDSYEFLESGSLIIKNASKSVAGVYRCVALNSLGKIYTVAELKIQAPPVFLITPFDQSVKLKSSLTLKCEASDSPSISWNLNGQPVLPSERISLTQKGRRLKISEITEDDEGEYTCIAENNIGRIESVSNLKVIHGSPPEFTHEIPQLIHLRGREMTLECTATGQPPPIIFWKKNGLAIVENSKTSILPNGKLILNNYHSSLDDGVYQCSAFNDYGLITSDSIRIEGGLGRRIYSEGSILLRRESIDDSIVYSAYVKAKKDVEVAEGDTIEQLFGNMSKTEIKNPSDLLRLSRFPRVHGRNIARSAEIYERALQIISEHVEKGMNFSLDGDFSYKDLLSPTQLESLGRFSGCISHRKPKMNCSQEMCFHSKYRSINGLCNNLEETLWGSSYTSFQRLLKSSYENGFNLPIGWNSSKLYNGFPLPSARLVSNEIVTTNDISPDTELTHMVMQWGQFLDHDLDHALPSLSIESFGERISCRRTCENVAPCFPIQAPTADKRIRSRKCMEFTRSAALCGSGMTSIFFDNIQQREQINQLTSYIDASQVYGSSEEELREIRNSSSPGFLRKGIYMGPEKPLMPFATDDNPIDCRRNIRESDVGCLLGGDVRANEQLGLLAMHNVWFRQHNFVAQQLKDFNPSWEDETLFQETRKIIGAQMQHITYAQWFPTIVGEKGMELLGQYDGYKPEVNPSITNEFATAAMRFGHTMINPVLRRLDANFQSIPEGDLPLRQAFFAPWRIVEEGGIDPLLRGLFTSSAKLRTPDQLLNSHLTNDLFSHAHLIALDLASMNIQRGRDHGLLSYNHYRTLCNLTRATSFDDLIEIGDSALRGKLERVYKHVDNIDLWVGGIAEDPQWDDARIGPTFTCILVDQFKRLRDGDRFFYENPSVFKPEQLSQIKQTTLAKIICDNGDKIAHIKRNVFLMDSPLVRCELVHSPQFAIWSTECCKKDSSCQSHNSASFIHNRENIESNQIRLKRDVRDNRIEKEEEDGSRGLKNNNMNVKNKVKISDKNDDMSISKWEKGDGGKDLNWLEETLINVTSTVSALQNRIQELETKCEKD